VVHRRVAHNGHFINLVVLHGPLPAQPPNQPIYTVYYDFVQFAQSVVALAIADSAYDIVAVPGLRIHSRLNHLTLTVCHIDQFGNNRGSADIDGNAENLPPRCCLHVFPVYIGFDFGLGGSLGENSLAEKPGSGRHRYRNITLDVIPARRNLLGLRLDNDKAFPADSFSAAY
jgi:hypothetical protein